jgi:plasmid stabilization system protein ParE
MLAQTVIDRIEQLAAHPGIGRPGEVKGTRELVVSAYVVVYRYTDRNSSYLARRARLAVAICEVRQTARQRFLGGAPVL